jgi:hypothetical protein
MPLIIATPFKHITEAPWQTFGPRTASAILTDYDSQIDFELVNDDQLLAIWKSNSQSNVKQGLINISGNDVSAQSVNTVVSGSAAYVIGMNSIPGSSPDAFIMYAQTGSASQLWVNSVSGGVITKNTTYSYSGTDRGTGVVMNTGSVGTVAMGLFTTDISLRVGRVVISGGTAVSIPTANTVAGVYPVSGTGVARVDNDRTLVIARNLSNDRVWASVWDISSSISMVSSTNISTVSKQWTCVAVKYLGIDTNGHYIYVVTYYDNTGFNYIQLIRVNYINFTISAGSPLMITGSYSGTNTSLRPIMASSNQVVLFANTTTYIYQADSDTLGISLLSEFTDSNLDTSAVDGYHVNSLNSKLLRVEQPGYCRTFY